MGRRFMCEVTVATKKRSSSQVLVSVNPEQAANQLRILADQLESGNIRNFKIEHSDNSIVVTADSNDGKERLIREQTAHGGGYVRNQTEHIKKQTPDQRREIVKGLAQEGKSQVEIAERTMVSQKTVSNDIKKLKDDGEL